jgi:DNA-directed RNA polymerase specialized sigma24 family protein
MLAHALDELKDLSPKKREVVVLKFSGELSYREISDVTGLSVSHVGVILHEALSHVRERFRQKGLLEAEPARPSPKNEGQSRVDVIRRAP